MKKRWIFAALSLVILSCGTAPRQNNGEPGTSASEKANRFIEKGYASRFSADDDDDFNAYIKRHGAPSRISRKEIVNRHDGIRDEVVTLEYGDREMRYYHYSPREAWKPPVSTLMAVLSLPGGKYLFGIGIGMGRTRLEELLGLAKVGDERIEIKDAKGRAVILMFKEDALERIIWDFSRE
jgi:hypothetical protein